VSNLVTAGARQQEQQDGIGGDPVLIGFERGDEPMGFFERKKPAAQDIWPDRQPGNRIARNAADLPFECQVECAPQHSEDTIDAAAGVTRFLHTAYHGNDAS
jgi:hypothetical protein